MIKIKTQKEIEIMRAGGKILAVILDKLEKAVRPGITTGDLEKMARSLIKEAGGRPSFKGYKGASNGAYFPTVLCTSINEEIVHTPALPARVLKSGDIIGIDIGMQYPYGGGKKGYYTDMAITVSVGKISKEAKNLIKITKKALALAIKKVKPGNTLTDIGRAVQACAENAGFSVVRDLVGHGVGAAVHEEPQIPNYVPGYNYEEIILKQGMTIALEPMINIGDYKIECLSDGFTFVTADKSLSAQFEHTVVVTKNGHEILTKI